MAGHPVSHMRCEGGRAEDHGPPISYEYIEPVEPLNYRLMFWI